MIEASLPETPSRADPAWIAMPRAIPLVAALIEAGIRERVEAIAVVAGTLADLAARHGIAHRDIKPGNLFQLDARPRVGDFGLVDFRDKKALTATSPARQLGPLQRAGDQPLDVTPGW